MEILTILFSLVSISISLYALYQSELFNIETKDINCDTRKMIEANEKSISDLHVSLREIIATDSVSLKADGLRIIKLQSYSPSYGKIIMKEISKLSMIIDIGKVNTFEKWLSLPNEAIELSLNVELSRELYNEMEVVFARIRKYGVWITVNIADYSNQKYVG